PAPKLSAVSPATRLAYLRRARIFLPMDTAACDILAGPAGPGAFPFRAEVRCDFAEGEVRRHGASPKFPCRSGDNLLKVRYRRSNGEVYAGVAAGRLFWALGMGADALYPVRVRCHGCPADPWASTMPRD